MKLTLNQAAKESEKAKKTILEALKSGRMAGSKNDKGHWEIDVSELFRVFPKDLGNHVEKPIPTPIETSVETEILKTKVDMLSERIEDLKKDRDRWQEQANRVTTLIEDQTQNKKGFWVKLLGL